MTIRSGHPDDISACVDLWLSALEARDGFTPPPQSRERAKAKFERPVVRFAVVESRADDIDGFALTVRAPGEVALLELIAVAPEATGRGAGGALLDDAIAFAAASGARVAELWVRRGNDRALTLYTSRGFGATGGLEAHPLLGEPMLQYRLALAPRH
ncbi:GNAT family N-acetyltransferase [Conyzicola sp.]|uniref:GNAT family N-acetyltransferase n=1 Tax=Conyzicola sp. TaxID=1969404 RepID=UPI003989CBAA